MKIDLSPITLEEVVARAPSVASQSPAPNVSNRYCHIKTIDLIPPLMEQGWLPVRATEQPCILPQRKGFQKHMVTFRREGAHTQGKFKYKPSDHKIEDSADNPEFFELHLINSHDRTTAWNFFCGLFRQVCANGLIVSKGLFAGERIKHININTNDVIQASLRVSGIISTVCDHADQMREIILPEKRRLDFAEFALMTKYGRMDLSPVSPELILTPRRECDQGFDLWRTMNVIQENLMRGLQKDPDRRDQFGRSFGVSNPIKKIDRQIEVNQALWEYAEQYLTAASN